MQDFFKDKSMTRVLYANVVGIAEGWIYLIMEMSGYCEMEIPRSSIPGWNDIGTLCLAQLIGWLEFFNGNLGSKTLWVDALLACKSLGKMDKPMDYSIEKEIPNPIRVSVASKRKLKWI